MRATMSLPASESASSKAPEATLLFRVGFRLLKALDHSRQLGRQVVSWPLTDGSPSLRHKACGHHRDHVRSGPLSVGLNVVVFRQGQKRLVIYPLGEVRNCFSARVAEVAP